MSDEISQKAGRGGAGNFHTKADVEDAPKANRPSQKPRGVLPRVETHSEPQIYARTGRGGLGNYISPSQELPSASSDSKGDLFSAGGEKLNDKVSSDKNSAYRGPSGRGGAGNWRQGNDDADKRKMEDEEMKVRNRIDEGIRLDVEKGLKPPPKVYAAP